jgi:phosphatidylglycerophosphate synthase
MRAVHSGPAIGLVTQVAVLAALDRSVGLSGPGWVVGISCGLIIAAALARGYTNHGTVALGPAAPVTLVRAAFAGGVAALTADSFSGPIPVATLVAFAIVALILDGVDGWVARRTQTASMLGARLDMEVDAFLILVLSGYVARSVGAWVLAIGAARYALLVAGRLWPWLRRATPPRFWGKVVAAVQGVVLTFAAADILPPAVVEVALAVALALLTESFGREVWWLRCNGRRAPSEIMSVPRLLEPAMAGARGTHGSTR